MQWIFSRATALAILVTLLFLLSIAYPRAEVATNHPYLDPAHTASAFDSYWGAADGGTYYEEPAVYGAGGTDGSAPYPEYVQDAQSGASNYYIGSDGQYPPQANESSVYDYSMWGGGVDSTESVSPYSAYSNGGADGTSAASYEVWSVDGGRDGSHFQEYSITSGGGSVDGYMYEPYDVAQSDVRTDSIGYYYDSAASDQIEYGSYNTYGYAGADAAYTIAYDSGLVYDDYVVEYVQQSQQDPWYVTAFPGIGNTIQQLVPPSMQPQPQTQIRYVAAPAQPPTCTISVHPSQITQGESVLLRWSSAGASRATLSPYGMVYPSNTITVSPNVTTAYTLQVAGDGGTAMCQTILTVVPPSATVQQPTPVVVTPSPISAPGCAMYATPSRVSFGGTAVLTWSSFGASGATLSGVGPVPLNGVYSASNLERDTPYVLTVVSAQGQTSTCDASVSVEPPPLPTCSISATPSSVFSGGATTLSWSSSGIHSATIAPSIGSVLGGGTRVERGIETSRTYVMTVRGAGGVTSTCSASVYVSSPVFEVPRVDSYQQPSVSTYFPRSNAPTVYPLTSYKIQSLPLSNLPYTGYGSPLAYAAFWGVAIVLALALVMFLVFTVFRRR